MKVQQFLAHYGIEENPFAQEDAQTDHVFRDHCLAATHHPAWDKIFGNPEHPSTSVVFGEKGAGKTALRLQIVGELRKFNDKNPERQVFIVEYDDFNPFLDSFRSRLRSWNRKATRALSRWRLWDHMDAILCLSTTKLVNLVLDEGRTDDPKVVSDKISNLSRAQRRDLLLLAALYDHTLGQPVEQRWNGLRKKLRFNSWWSQWDLILGAVVSAGVAGAAAYFWPPDSTGRWLLGGIFAAGWGPWLQRQLGLLWKSYRVSREVRVFDHLINSLRRLLSRFERQELAGQPMPTKDRSDDRYELLAKLQNLLKTLGFGSMLVLVDRVDEPHLVNGSAERIKDLVWPLFDNKFLKHIGIGFKLLLPSEVTYYLKREEKEFYERSRLDKQNLILSLEWTGESLYDVANNRIRACVKSPSNPVSIQQMFDESITEAELIRIFAQLRVPRHLFKFLYRLLVEHCNRYTEQTPSWRVNRETLQSALALYMRDLDAFDRGMGTV
jgi:hypothetical protein